jgi:hypothetical protein
MRNHSSNPNDDVELCDKCGQHSAHLVTRGTRITLECSNEDCGHERLIKYERGTMDIPGSQKRIGGI